MISSFRKSFLAASKVFLNNNKMIAMGSNHHPTLTAIIIIKPTANKAIIPKSNNIIPLPPLFIKRDYTLRPIKEVKIFADYFLTFCLAGTEANIAFSTFTPCFLASSSLFSFLSFIYISDILSILFILYSPLFF